MRRKHLSFIAFVVLGSTLFFPFNLAPKVSASNLPDLLTRRIRATTVKGESIDQVLDRLIEYGIPVGIELGDEKLTPRREINLNLPETNLKDFLDSLIAKDSRYVWRLEAGVIHFCPVYKRDTLIATLLDVKISHFSIVGGTSRYRIFDNILELPEIKAQLITAGVEPMSFLASGSMTRVGEETLFKESSLTLRELLDKIVLKTEIKQWVIIRWGENSEYISLKLG